MSARIMVIDNAESIRRLFDAILAGEGWLAFTYTYAQVGLDVVHQVKPDLIILDFTMHQGGEGWAFLQLLKMDATTAAIPVLICTTAAVLPLEIQGYLASHAISTIYKPFDSTPFLLKVHQILASVNPLEEPEADDLALPILVVDDNENLRESIMTVLRLEGYLVVTTDNGRLALQAATNARYGLIILDVEMPVMNGLEFLAAYAQQPGPHSPVIIYSGRADLLHEVFSPIVIGKLVKPFPIDQLVTLVKKYVQPIR